MGLYKSSITTTQGDRNIQEYYGSNVENAGQCHKFYVETIMEQTVLAQKVTPFKNCDGFPNVYDKSED